MDAAVGRGSGQVRLQTRSGTNEFHGALFHSNQNSKIAANNWFQNLVGTPKDYLNRNQYNMRFDYQLNSSNKVSFSLTKENNWGVTGQTGLPDWPGGYFGEIRRNPTFSTASWTSTFDADLQNGLGTVKSGAAGETGGSRDGRPAADDADDS